MGNTLYLECYSGISGDMTVAALLDLGADEEVLKKVLKSLPVQGFEVKISRVMKSGIDACDFDVILDENYENHDHDMAYLHGHDCIEKNHHGHEDFCEESHACAKKHRHNETHEKCAGNHHHEHRGIEEISHIIEHSSMTDRAKDIALRIFTVLAGAEAKAHNVPVEKVHFHEVGAVDSIVDIVAAAVCLDNLDITEVIVPKVCEGYGTIRCQHGILPVPVPAVTEIIRAHKIQLKLTDVQGELVTPTGAAIIAAIRTGEQLPDSFIIRKTGTGAGKRNYHCPGILRAMLIDDSSKAQDAIIKMETNIDDCSGETLGYVMEKLLNEGARDVCYIPVYMKKNRPAWILSVICKKEDMEKLQNIIFEETTTIGIRYTAMDRTIMKREQRTVQTPFGAVEIKICSMHGKEHFYPEYDSVAKVSREKQIPFREVYDISREICRKEYYGRNQ